MKTKEQLKEDHLRTMRSQIISHERDIKHAKAELNRRKDALTSQEEHVQRMEFEFECMYKCIAHLECENSTYTT